MNNHVLQILQIINEIKNLNIRITWIGIRWRRCGYGGGHGGGYCSGYGGGYTYAAAPTVFLTAAVAAEMAPPTAPTAEQSNTIIHL